MSEKSAAFRLRPATPGDLALVRNCLPEVLRGTPAAQVTVALDSNGSLASPPCASPRASRGAWAASWAVAPAVPAAAPRTAPSAAAAEPAGTPATPNPYTLSLSSSPGGEVNTWTFNWGDGTTSTVAGSATSVTHNYPVTSSYNNGAATLSQ